MNPYTTMWTGVADDDGPQSVHIVLVDNGRTRALADPVGRQALRCIRCSACLNFCPVYERTGGHAYGSVYPGPIGAILNPLLNGVDAGPVEKSLPYASSLCGRCFEVCPVRIDIPDVLVHLRGKVVDASREHRVPTRRDARDARGRVDVRAAEQARRASQRLTGLRAAAARRPGRARAHPVPGPGREVEPGPRHPAAAARVVPCLVAADPRKAAQEGEILMGAREEVLGRIRAALADVGPRTRMSMSPRLSPQTREQPEGTVERFCERVADYKATVERVPAGGRRRGGGRRAAPSRRAPGGGASRDCRRSGHRRIGCRIAGARLPGGAAVGGRA